MATTSKKTTNESQGSLAEDLKEKYKEYILTHGHEPTSVFLFSKDLGLKEEIFYQHYGSFTAIQSAIWTDLMEDTISAVKGDKIYAEYSSRERLLGFYYTLMERLKRDRSYVKYTIDNKIRKPEIIPAFLQDFRHRFVSFVEELLNEGLEKGEIAHRPVITKRYKDGLWLQLAFVMNFWLKDDSANFEKTDAAIEKSVNLAFEFMAEGPLERVIDFAKFLYQNK
jgi:hypothetical protein